MELTLTVIIHACVIKHTATTVVMLMSALACGVQTCIMIRRTPEYILAGADSKSTSKILISDEQGLSIKDAGGDSIQKIKSSNGIFFASSGIGRMGSFDVDALAAQACDEAPSAPEALENFRRVALAPLFDALATIRNHWTEYFVRKAVDSDALGIAFFRMDGQTPTVAALSVTAVITTETSFNLEQHIYTCPGTIEQDKTFDFFLGRSKASAGEEGKPAWRSNPIRAITNLIMAEAKARPETVAPPVRIMRLDSRGPRWVK